jgi:hypothetical protein
VAIRELSWINQRLTCGTFCRTISDYWRGHCFSEWWLSRAWLSHSLSKQQNSVQTSYKPKSSAITLKPPQIQKYVSQTDTYCRMRSPYQGYLFPVWSNISLKLSLEKLINMRHYFVSCCWHRASTRVHIIKVHQIVFLVKSFLTFVE